MSGMRPSLLPFLIASLLLTASAASGQTDFVTFESGQVRPLILSPDGSRLLALNTPEVGTTHVAIFWEKLVA